MRQLRHPGSVYTPVITRATSIPPPQAAGARIEAAAALPVVWYIGLHLSVSVTNKQIAVTDGGVITAKLADDAWPD